MTGGDATAGLTGEDRARLEARGIDAGEAERQLALLRDPPPPVRLVRPCTPGDGIETLDASRYDSLCSTWDAAARAGRVSRFVPASGAASRMFKLLLAARSRHAGAPIERLRELADAGDDAAGGVVRLVDELERLPVPPPLLDAHPPARRAAGTAWTELVDALVGETGLDWARLPKGLLPFHSRPDGTIRTPFEEHFVEAGDYGRGADGTCRLHFTISSEHRAGFESALEGVRRRLEPALGVRFDVSFSEQSPSTDTLAVDPRGRPVRDDAGHLLLRPGGHGALLGNLAGTSGDIVVVKNIDNVVPDERKGPTLLWKKLLVGRLVELERHVGALALALAPGAGAGEMLDAGAEFVSATLGAGTAPADDAGRRRAWLLGRLERPLRVCGVVRNTGEPGGGPFWVEGPDGRVSRQIVESSEVDLDDASQRAIWESSTHFNPVDLVCALRDHHGRPWDLERYVDPGRVFIARKSAGGRELLALERPGLWNGAMARWNTVFVDVPGETFAPVKTLYDLLRPEHQPG